MLPIIKRYVLAFSLLLTACSPGSEPTQQAPAAAVEAPVAARPEPVDTVRGFGRHHFGDDLRSFPPLALVHQSRPDLATYQAPAEDGQLRFGLVALTKVLYTFYQNKLYGISLYAAGPEGLRQLTAEATSRYGSPSQVLEGLAAWGGGQQVQADMGHSQLNEGQEYYLKLMSLPLYHQLEASIAAEQASGR